MKYAMDGVCTMHCDMGNAYRVHEKGQNGRMASRTSVIHQKLPFLQLVKKFPALYET
jgi:hypothetical protein